MGNTRGKTTGKATGNTRRKYKLADRTHKNVDLRQYEKIIVDTVNKTIPDKNPKVFKEYFSTDPLTQREAVLLGRALAKLDELNVYGKEITTFRLFDGKIYSDENSNKPISRKG
jgi:hypothetical protein